MIILIIFLVLFLVCGVGAYALWQLGQGALRMTSSIIGCTMSFEMSHKASLAYAKEHGGKLPDAAKWQEQIAPYYKRLESKMFASNKELKDNPFFKFEPGDITKPLPCDFGEPTTTITYNADLSGKVLDSIKDPTGTVMFFEGLEAVTNANGVYKERSKKDSPKIMGSPREWLDWHVNQEGSPFKGSTKGDLDFEIKMEDALGEGKPDPAPGSAPAAK